MSESEFSSWLTTAKKNGLLNRTYSCLSSPGTNRSCGEPLCIPLNLACPRVRVMIKAIWSARSFPPVPLSFKFVTSMARKLPKRVILVFYLGSFHPLCFCGDFISKISAYADNATLILKEDGSVTRCFDTIEHFEAANDGKLNYEKTDGIYIGRQAGRGQGPVPITWKTDYISILRARIGNNVQQEWQKHTEKLENTLNRWKDRHLTIYGKKTLLQTFAVAPHRLSCCPVSTPSHRDPKTDTCNVLLPLSKQP